ncbi:unnamed protein product [Peniophora sp. CBMAI 1063]|nr:unnamed protein product [Peniophora sp. CBMAI 1063]
MDAMDDFTSDTVLSDTDPDLYRHKNTLAHSVVNETLIAADSEAADFYKLVSERALAGDAPHGAQGNYVLENGEFSFSEAAKRYTAVLHAHGKSAKAEPDSFTAAEIEKTPFIYFLGTDVRIRGDRSRQLGWSPAHVIEDFYESVQEDTEAVLAGKD